MRARNYIFLLLFYYNISQIHQIVATTVAPVEAKNQSQSYPKQYKIMYRLRVCLCLYTSLKKMFRMKILVFCSTNTKNMTFFYSISIRTWNSKFVFCICIKWNLHSNIFWKHNTSLRVLQFLVKKEKNTKKSPLKRKRKSTFFLFGVQSSLRQQHPFHTIRIFIIFR